MTVTLIVFLVVYLGMILGDLPFLQIDRTGIALLGSIALVGGGVLTPEAAVRALHLPTLILLFAFMVVSAQLRLGGFYGWVTLGLAARPLRPPLLLGALAFAVGGLSAVFSNDIVCLAVAPVLVDICRRRRLNPVPYLLALACAANVGSAATLIGNPQNMLIGATLRLSFGGYALEALGPVLLGCLLYTSQATSSGRNQGHSKSFPGREIDGPLEVAATEDGILSRPSRSCLLYTSRCV